MTGITVCIGEKEVKKDGYRNPIGRAYQLLNIVERRDRLNVGCNRMSALVIVLRRVLEKNKSSFIFHAQWLYCLAHSVGSEGSSMCSCQILIHEQ